MGSFFCLFVLLLYVIISVSGGGLRFIDECVPHVVLLIWWYNTVVDLNAGRMA